jgi:hypothetical protein
MNNFELCKRGALMRKHNIAAWLVLSFVTLGIGAIVWIVRTKNDMNTRGAGIPSAFLIIVPIANIWWMWKWSQGVEISTGKSMSGAVAFLLLFLLGAIGQAIVQTELNKAADQPALPTARTV